MENKSSNQESALCLYAFWEVRPNYFIFNYFVLIKYWAVLIWDYNIPRRAVANGGWLVFILSFNIGLLEGTVT